MTHTAWPLAACAVLRAVRRPVIGAVRSCLLLTLVVAGCLVAPSGASAQATWRLEQPAPPPPEAGVPPAPGPVGLGKVGDIKFFAPNLGVLITAGNPPTIKPGVWIYNGEGWRELSTVCGATDGRIAWAGQSEFWTISDGRAGQNSNGAFVARVDETLCRFVGEAGGKVSESFATPLGEADSYQHMNAAVCLGSGDCWFGGESLPEDNAEVGAFQLHWNGTTVEAAPYLEESYAIQELLPFDGRVYQSVQPLPACSAQRPSNCGRVTKPRLTAPALHVLDPGLPGGFAPELQLEREELYGSHERPWALGYLHLATGSEALWAAAGKRPAASSEEPERAREEEPELSKGPPSPLEEEEARELHAGVTLVRYDPEAEEWTQVLGPSTHPSGGEVFPKETVEALATEPGSSEEHLWLALQSNHEAREAESGIERFPNSATVVQLSKEGSVLSREPLPGPGEGSAKGGASKLTCPAVEDCWLVTAKGWLFHYAPEGERTLPANATSGFDDVITERPQDKGLPQTLPDSVPAEESGQLGEAAEPPPKPTVVKAEEARVPVALISNLHTRLVRGTTLELRFHLAAKARLQLLARRKHHVVARSRALVFKPGNRSIALQLSRQHWPTELHLVEHALVPLPTVSANAGASETVTTGSLAFPARLPQDGLGLP
jgi:hypothetical protein